MKHTKKLLALLLTLVIALGFSAPVAFAQETEAKSTVNWDEFYIVTQPQDVKIKKGESFMLAVQANSPNGVEVTYQWYRDYVQIKGAASPDLHLDSQDFFPVSETAIYHCTITASEKDADGSEIASKTLQSISARVRITKTLWSNLWKFLVESVLTIGSYIVVGLGIFGLSLGWPFIALWGFINSLWK